MDYVVLVSYLVVHEQEGCRPAVLHEAHHGLRQPVHVHRPLQVAGTDLGSA